MNMGTSVLLFGTSSRHERTSLIVRSGRIETLDLR
jgi:hypothetical protein